MKLGVMHSFIALSNIELTNDCHYTESAMVYQGSRDFDSGHRRENEQAIHEMLLEEVIALGTHEREKSSRHIVSSHDKSFKFPPEFS